MAYTKKTWVSGETPLSAENMNHIEQGVADAHNDISSLNTNKTTCTIEPWSKSFTFTMRGGSHAIVCANNNMYMIWRSGSGIASQLVFGASNSVTFTESNGTVTCTATSEHTFTVFYLEP